MNEIEVKLHNVIVWVPSKKPEFKVTQYSYLAPKVHIARKWFEAEHPDETIVKIFSLGVGTYKISRERYRAIYENT